MKYKETRIGIVPEHWEVLPIKDITEVVTDYVANGSFASLAENVTYKDEEDVAVLIRLWQCNSIPKKVLSKAIRTEGVLLLCS